VDLARLRTASLLGFSLLGLSWGAWGVAVPAVLRDTGATEAQLGFGLLVLAAGAVPAMALTGRFLERTGFRALGAIVPVFALSWLPVAVAPSVAVLVGSLFAVGVLSGATDVAINAAAAEVERSRERPLLPLAHATFSFSVVAGALGTGLVRQADGRPLISFVVIAGVAIAVVGKLAAGGTPRKAHSGDVGARQGRVALPRLALIAVGLLVAMGFLVENAHQTWGARLLESELGAPPALGALAPVVFACATGTSRLALQWLTVRMTTTAIVTAGALVTAVGTLMAALGSALPVAVAGFLLAGVGTAVVAPALIALAGRTGGAGATARAVSMVATIGYAGFFFSPAIVGVTATSTSLSGAFILVAGFAVLLAVAARAILPVIDRKAASRPGRLSQT
jgi:MFS family permease